MLYSDRNFPIKFAELARDSQIPERLLQYLQVDCSANCLLSNKRLGHHIRPSIKVSFLDKAINFVNEYIKVTHLALEEKLLDVFSLGTTHLYGTTHP